MARQSVQAEKISVYIPKSYKRFPDWDGTLPSVRGGVDIVRCDEDFGPATKLLPALIDHSGQDIDILFCDDDMDYPKNWASWFLRQRSRQPQACIALVGENAIGVPGQQRQRPPMPRPLLLWASTNPEYWGRRWGEALRCRWLGAPRRYLGRRCYLTGGFQDMFQGFGGVLVKPSFFDDTVFDIPADLWSVDDYWLSGCAVKNGHAVWVIPMRREPDSFPFAAQDALTDAVIGGFDRDAANTHAERYLRERFDIWN
ncbi:hypothetical protein [Shimia abyssi]|uniref:hypothetical protein n=1 Tax=Shimia abyssi TaxID=1662395 RepID=UPI0010574CE0|nr:hypothetical protein [Shimia abyssi]